jgi:hypothetical protein
MDKTKLEPTVALAAAIALLICFFLPWPEFDARPEIHGEWFSLAA